MKLNPIYIYTTEKKPISTSLSEAKMGVETRELKLKKTLDNLYNKYNNGSYLSSSVLGVVRRFSSKEDFEVVGLIGASLAYGSVAQSRIALEKLLGPMEDKPYEFILNFNQEKEKEILRFRYRYINGRQMLGLFEKMSSILSEYGSFENLFREALSLGDEDITKALINFCDKIRVPFLISSPKRGSACKRMCLFLRWMVRRDNVDSGVWDVPTSLLIIPVDRHVARISYYLGFLDRIPPGPTWNNALRITQHLKRLDPYDPTRYDFAISRLGILKECDNGVDKSVCKQCNLYEICRFGLSEEF